MFPDGYGVYLAEMVLDTGLDLGLRQLASVMLKQYVEESWTINDESEKLHPLASDQAKKMIKSILPEGLYDPNSKVRSLVFTLLRRVYLIFQTFSDSISSCLHNFNNSQL